MLLRDLQVGFEFEFTSSFDAKDIKTLLRANVGAKFSGLKKHRWQLTTDTSVVAKHTRHSGHELITPPMPYETALQKLGLVLDFLQYHECRTNNTCGLHVNISFGNTKFNAKMDPLKLVLLMKEGKYAKDFQRSKNEYCQSIKVDMDRWYLSHDIPLTTWKQKAEFLNTKLKDRCIKYRTVNLTKWYEHQYMEFRYMGNTGYEFKFKEIKRHISMLGKTMYAAASGKNTMEYQIAIGELKTKLFHIQDVEMEEDNEEEPSDVLDCSWDDDSTFNPYENLSFLT